ncbi:hypothetical protein KC660_04460 [Candidatus Dojkabacteria bacterium]|uniref:Uncharacterized protein n=1 Tax=Candidatus Dojkabacteria bacterium TaxID=2099670 RepID=A0A955L436_9BACT|nr:hypothetical protein [Candidatus Dojkabacteria bacterium]
MAVETAAVLQIVHLLNGDSGEIVASGVDGDGVTYDLVRTFDLNTEWIAVPAGRFGEDGVERLPVPGESTEAGASIVVEP